MQPSEILLGLVGRDAAGRPEFSGFDLTTNSALRQGRDLAVRSGRRCGVIDLFLSLYSVLSLPQAELVYSHGFDEQKLRGLNELSEPAGGECLQSGSPALDFPYCFDEDVCLSLLGARGIAANVGAALVGCEHLLLALTSTGNAGVLAKLRQSINLSTFSSALFALLTEPLTVSPEAEPIAASSPSQTLSRGLKPLSDYFSNELFRACLEAEAIALAAGAGQVEFSHLLGRLFAASSIGLSSSYETGEESSLLAQEELDWSESLLCRLSNVSDGCWAQDRLVEVLDVLSALLEDEYNCEPAHIPVLLPGRSAAIALLKRLRLNGDLLGISEGLSQVYDQDEPFSACNVHLFPKPILLAAFDEPALKDWLHAEWQARACDLPCVYDDVLLASLLRHGAGSFNSIFGKLGLDERSLYSELRSLRRGAHGQGHTFAASRLSAASLCAVAYGGSLLSGSAFVEPRHLLYAVLSALDSFSLRLMRSLGAQVNNLYFYGQVEHLINGVAGAECEDFAELPEPSAMPGPKTKPGSRTATDWLEEFRGWKDERPYPRFSDQAWSIITSAIARSKAERGWVACSGDLFQSIVTHEPELVSFLSVYGNYSADKIRSSLASTCLAAASEPASSVSEQVSATVRRVFLRATAFACGKSVEPKHILYALLSGADCNQVTRGLARLGLNRWKLAYNLNRTMC